MDPFYRCLILTDQAMQRPWFKFGKKDNLLDYDMQVTFWISNLQILSSLMLKIGFHTKWRLWTWPKYKEIEVFLYLLPDSLGWLAYSLPSKVTITKWNKTRNQINRIVNLFLFKKVNVISIFAKDQQYLRFLSFVSMVPCYPLGSAHILIME